MNPGHGSEVSDIIPPALLPGEAQVYCFSLDRDPALLAQLEATLTADERQRAARFRSPIDQQRFIAARGTMRLLLGRYLHQAPGEVRFGYGPNGKPSLQQSSGSPGLRFNLSHSNAMGLLAVTLGQEIGVDVEWIRPMPDAVGIAQRFFAPGELATLLGLAKDYQREAFFACWTRKEAYLKARGGGLSIPLDRFEVSLAPGEPARLLRIVDEPEGHLHWSLHDLPHVAGYSAALAVHGAVSRIAFAWYRDETIA
jgi:4'-phosphopantetheinyl transferase